MIELFILCLLVLSGVVGFACGWSWRDGKRDRVRRRMGYRKNERGEWE